VPQALSNEDVLALADLVEYVGHPVLPCTRIKRMRARHDPDAIPTLQREMDQIARDWAEVQPTAPSAQDLYRASSAATFHRHCTRREWRPEAVGYAEFRSEVERTASADRSSLLRGMLNQNAPVFPFPHSWLVAGDDIPTLNGDQLVRRLKLRGQEPPFVVTRLTLDLMASSGVEVRAASVLDAVLGRKLQWHEDEVLGEVIDLDVGCTAIADLWWVS
jgi:hypothetical protein